MSRSPSHRIRPLRPADFAPATPARPISRDERAARMRRRNARNGERRATVRAYWDRIRQQHGDAGMRRLVRARFGYEE